MLDSLRRLLTKGPKRADLSALRAWAESKGHGFRHVRDSVGCTIEPARTGEPGWRIEWGESQRSYVLSHELRITCDLATPKDLVALVVNRALMETMERSVFDQYVEDVQTRIDTETPPEMRWLVLFPKLAPNEMGRLRERYAAVGSHKAWLQQWLSGKLDDALTATLDVVGEDAPVVLTIARGRLMLRTASPQPDVATLTRWFAVFEAAAHEARRMAVDWVEPPSGAPSTQPAAWPSAHVGDGNTP